MKVLPKILAFAAVSAAACFMISCQQSSNDESAPDNSADTAAVSAAKEALTVTDTILPGDSTISLPAAVTGYSGVSVTWASDNTVVIAADGTVTVPDGTGTTTVTLTATIKKGESSVTKTFTVTVCQKNKELSDADYVAAAKKHLSITYTESTYADQDVTLPSTVTVGGKSVSVAWTATSDAAHLALNSDKTACTIHRDIVDVTGTLSAALTYGTASDSAEVSVTVGHVSEIAYSYSDSSYSSSATYTFDGSTLTYIRSSVSDSDSNKTGKKYSYTADSAKKTLSLSMTAYSPDGKAWYTESQYKTLLTDQYSGSITAMKAFVANPSLDTFIPVIQAQMPGATKEFAEQILVSTYSSSFNNVTSVAAFEALTADQLKAGFDSMCKKMQTEAASTYGLESTADWDSIFTAMSASISAMVTKLMSQVFISENITYTYSVDTVQDSGYTNYLELTATAQWKDGTAWYKQAGEFSHDSTETDSWYASISVGTLESLNYKGTTYYGSFNANYTLFTESYIYDENDNKVSASGTWTISCDSTNHTVTATNSSDSTQTFTASFEGSSLN